MTKILFKELSYAVVGAAMEVHRTLGPGFLESVYEAALAHELTLRGIPFEQQKRLPVHYKGQRIGEYVADLSSRWRDHSGTQGGLQAHSGA